MCIRDSSDFYQQLSGELSEDLFVTAFHRHVFAQLKKHWEAGGAVDLTHLSADFDPQEFGRVTRLFMNRALYLNTPEECRDYIRILREEKEKETKQAQDFSDDDVFLRSFSQLKEKKQ